MTRRMTRYLAVSLAGIMITAYFPSDVNATSSDTIIAPISWERSSEATGAVMGVVEREWNWGQANRISTPLRDPKKVWDGKYKPYYTKYVSALGSNVHSSATWKTQNKVDLRRFRGTFQIPVGYSTEDFVRLRSVVQEQYKHLNGGNIVPINDNIYIFVYPEAIKELINDDPASAHYYMNYLAFWTGTTNKTNQDVIQSFHGVAGTYANRDVYNGPKVTDGWYAYATLDNIGDVMHRTTGGEGAKTKFILDIFTEDNSPGHGGGMDEMVLEFKKNPRAQVEANDETYAIPSGKEILVDTSKGLLANETLQQSVICEIKEGRTGDFNLVKADRNTFRIYKNEIHIGDITYSDTQGQFKILPVKDYIGEMKWTYEVKDKLGKQDEAVATVYVMPYVDIKYVEVEDHMLLDQKRVYGNPYIDLPKDTIWLKGVQNIDDKVLIDTSQKLLDSEMSYSFVEGTIYTKGEQFSTIESLPYDMAFGKYNSEVILNYEQQIAHVSIEHQYSEDQEANYKETMYFDREMQLNIKDYIDTSAAGRYDANTKYELRGINIETADGESYELNAPINMEEIVRVTVGKDYTLTYIYDVKAYNVQELHILRRKEIEEVIEEKEQKVKYGSYYNVQEMNVPNYTLKMIQVNDQVIEDPYQDM